MSENDDAARLEEAERRDTASLAPLRMDEHNIAVPWLRKADDGTRERGYDVVNDEAEPDRYRALAEQVG